MKLKKNAFFYQYFKISANLAVFLPNEIPEKE
jgi:hypothetical protein